jgi:hypothetical protein
MTFVSEQISMLQSVFMGCESCWNIVNHWLHHVKGAALKNNFFELTDLEKHFPNEP